MIRNYVILSTFILFILAASPAAATEPTSTPTESVPVETSSIPVETASVPVETQSVPPPSGSIGVPIEGEVNASTHRPPREHITQPPTDRLGERPMEVSSDPIIVVVALIAATMFISALLVRRRR